MPMSKTPAIVGSLLAVLAVASARADLPEVEFNSQGGQVTISIGQIPVAYYVYEDEEISRPYFANVGTLNGLQVTRHHPPIVGSDVSDHSNYHPGIWMAFGDISGADSWRMKVPVKHVEFVEGPTDGAGEGSFTVRNRYIHPQDPSQVICEERCRIDVRVLPEGKNYIIAWDSEFSSDQQFSFGDQEEMGLGFRVATPIRVAKDHKETNARIIPGNGTIQDADGRKNETEIWGESSSWCDYSGTLNRRTVGLAVMCHPDNFRPSWFHARDYGLLVANAFGRDAFKKGDKSEVVVRPGEKFRLRYGILVHEGATPDFEAIYEGYAETE